MRVVCPNCSAAYEVPQAMLGAAPRRLRCARCSEEWTVEAGDREPDLAVAAVPPHPDPQAQPDVVARAMAPAAPVSAGASSVPPASFSPPPPAPGPQPKLELRMPPQPIEPPELRAFHPEFEPRDQRGPRLPPRRRSGASALFGWVVTLALLGGALYGAYVFRGDVMAIWPPSARVYAALGLR